MSHPSDADEVSIPQQFSLLASNVLQVNLSHLFHFRGFEEMEQPPLVSALQYLLDFSNKSLKTPDHSSLTGFLEFRLRASHSSLRLAVLAVSVLVLPNLAS